MLTINFSQIKKSAAPLIHLEQELEIRPEFLARSKNLLISAKNVRVSADLFYNEPFVTGDFHVLADLVVPSSRSLTPVEYHEDFHFSENYSERDATKDELEEDSLPIVKVDNDRIDLQTAIEDNILLNIPVTILTPKEEAANIFPEGDGWEVVSEADFIKGKENQVNPAFAQLKVLLNQDKSQGQKRKK
ncbi:DUF177 domain-containing protein [Lactobacillus sp. ESL0791]|uniref:DUF177 domain-containing protein n=1 Tax=Lactobacillus sp. ESL0791 TaxID=2983234 RepID=UPI0023F75166|nr:DUF177 domain-containing protein [Lactobacillus sp. ESL0791]MDF7639163.1 DUF177 domain-containing protein [Lactobacillus sp. ESL0791]